MHSAARRNLHSAPKEWHSRRLFGCGDFRKISSWKHAPHHFGECDVCSARVCVCRSCIARAFCSCLLPALQRITNESREPQRMHIIPPNSAEFKIHYLKKVRACVLELNQFPDCAVSLAAGCCWTLVASSFQTVPCLWSRYIHVSRNSHSTHCSQPTGASTVLILAPPKELCA